MSYPPVPRVDLVEELHGVPVADPYRALEDLESEATRNFVEEQNRVTRAWLDAVPGRDVVRERLRELWRHESFGVPFRRGGRVFYRHNSGSQDQSVVFVTDDDTERGRVLLDPNTLSTDGTVAVGTVHPSPDGRLLAYAVQGAGSDWITWRVRDVETGEDLPDRLEWSKFSGASWCKDASGFFYSRYDAPEEGKTYEAQNKHQKVCFHRLGEEQSGDRLVLSVPEDPDSGFGARVRCEGTILAIEVWRGTSRENRLWYAPVAPDGATGEVVRVLDEEDAGYHLAGCVPQGDGVRFLLRTDLDAPRGRVIAVDVLQGGGTKTTELIAQTADTLRGVSLIGGRLVCEYLHDARSLVRVHELDGAHVRDVDLPGIGTAGGFGGEPSDPVTYYAFTGFGTPAEIHRLDVGSGADTVLRRTEIPFDASRFETRQVFYTSKDGTRIPMFVTHRRGLQPSGDAPTYLYGYGGFDIPLTPAFSVTRAVWLEMGGVYAVANLRGGGEYGEEWHDQGRLLKKQNTFDDFCAAAEWLIDEGWTRSDRLAIGGGSNGGLLVGACMTQRPELFGAAIPEVGVLDMLRYHKFTIGWAWASDYGSPDEPEHFANLVKYSPYHNLKPGTSYPATMVMTGDHDDRVVPSHSFKFAAALQHAQAGPAPCLIRIETRAGHGAGKPISKLVDEAADRWAFLVRALGFDVPDSLR